MSTEWPSLDSLPQDIMREIAASTEDPSTIWAIIATCRSLKAGAELALTPYFRERRILAIPPMTESVFMSIDSDLASTSTARNQSMVHRCQRFESLSTFIPLAGTAIRRLIVEVTDEPNSPGWAQIRRFAAQLQSLEVHVRESTWARPIEVLRSGGGGSLVWWKHTPRVWGEALAGISFPLLVDLTLVTTSRVGEHFLRLAPFIPNLQSLTLSCHQHSDLDEGQHTIIAELLPKSATFPHLKTLILAGHATFIDELARRLLPKTPSLRALTIHLANIKDSMYDTITPSTMRRIIHWSVECSRLQMLALYGYAAYYFPGVLRDLERMGGAQAMLGVERLVSDGRGLASHELASRPTHYMNSRPSLPALKELVFITLESKSRYTDRPEPKLDFPPPFVDSVRSLFDHYSGLSRLDWVNSYAKDPFVSMSDPVWASQHHTCSVLRPRDDQPLDPVFPNEVPSAMDKDSAGVDDIGTAAEGTA